MPMPMPINDLDKFGLDAPMALVDSPDSFSPSAEPGASRYRHTYPGDRHLDTLVVNKQSDTLVVSFHGALNRERYSLPRFERLASLLSRDVSSMYFSDPTLWMSDRIQLAWFTGWKGVNIQQDIADWILKTATTIGATRIILSGSSGGGFATLQVGSLITNSLALPFNPQTSIHRYYNNGDPTMRGVERFYYRTVHPEAAPGSLDNLDLEEDWTVRVGDELSPQRRYSAPTPNWVLYAHNPNDWHYDQHYLPFLAAAAKGENLGRIRVYEYDGRVGHHPPNPTEFTAGLDAALAWSRELPPTL